MLTTVLDASLTRALAIALIRGYQRFISPYKGFRCAHRVLHGGHSCSAHGLRLVRRVGLTRFMPLMRRRFARCSAAADELRLGHAMGFWKRRRKRRKRDGESYWKLDCCLDVGCEAVECEGLDVCHCS